jgi:acetyl-CoA carboxylase biotin carboxyl carrier protein
MEMDKIRELIQLVEDSHIQEIELSQRGETIRISKAVAAAAAIPVAPAPVAIPVPPASAPASPSPDAAAPAPEASRAAEGLTEITSPIVGTFYTAASPESAPFVEVGQRVMPGDVLCIVEAMKVMNEIESEYAGVIREITMANGQPVEFGQVLFLIDRD